MFPRENKCNLEGLIFKFTLGSVSMTLTLFVVVNIHNGLQPEPPTCERLSILGDICKD